MTPRPAQVLIVDDHPLVRLGLRQLIEDQPGLEVSGEAEDAPEALEHIDTTCPDLVVVDISLKRTNGLPLIEKIRSKPHPPRVLVYSMHDESVYAERALQAGAAGYVNKQDTSANVIEAILKVLSGELAFSDTVARRLLARTADHDLESPGDYLASLSNRELEVFDLIGQGLTIGQIAESLNRSPKTIETHRDRIRQKLGLHSAHELVRRATLWKSEEK